MQAEITPFVEFLVGITLKIQLKVVLFFGHPVCISYVFLLFQKFIFSLYNNERQYLLDI